MTALPKFLTEDPVEPLTTSRSAYADEDEQTLAEQQLGREEREKRRLARKPDISHLKPGVAEVNGELLPLFDVGSKIVVERRSGPLKNQPWLDTRVYRVRMIDDDTGVIGAWDEEWPHGTHNCFLSFKDGLHDIRLAPKVGNPFVSRKERPKPEQDPDAPKRKRGRPLGSKNRPKPTPGDAQ